MHLIVNPIEASGLTFMLERKIIAESAEWSKTVWPSLRDLGLKNVRDLHGKWARRDGEDGAHVHEARRHDGRGEHDAVCGALRQPGGVRGGLLAERGGKPASTEADPGDIDMGPNGGSNGATPASNAERETAKQFLGVLVKQANGDVNVLAGLIASMPLVNKYFSITSPEVVELETVAA